MTRLNDKELVINAEMIETVEATPDTVITLTTGQRYVVRQSVEEVVRRVMEYRRGVFGGLLRRRPPSSPSAPRRGG